MKRMMGLEPHDLLHGNAIAFRAARSRWRRSGLTMRGGGDRVSA